MFGRYIAVSVITTSILLFLCGLYYMFVEIERNACQMTYMYEMPQYTEIKLDKKMFPNYGLFYYNEGRIKVNITALNGAPVLFVPGNGGSFKQVRSLASVALQMKKGRKFNVHLDYFAINYDEELSAVSGQYLEKQRVFMELCIEAIMKIYNNVPNKSRKIAIVGHSMGGVVAKNILNSNKFQNNIATMLFISSPIDRPVFNYDIDLNRFYEQSNQISREKRSLLKPNSLTKECTEYDEGVNEGPENVVLVSIGGGDRDLLVPSEFTQSHYSDIHSMTSSIPSVWLSCDHLSAVWCLQLVKVINKFLFSITSLSPEKYSVYKENFQCNLKEAYRYFIESKKNLRTQEISFDLENLNSSYKDSENIYNKVFKNGLKKPYTILLPLEKLRNFEKIYIRLTANKDFNWLYACVENNHNLSKGNVCREIESLSQFVNEIPSVREKKFFSLIDISEILMQHKHWTHILVQIPPTPSKVSFYLNVLEHEAQHQRIKPPHWFDLTERTIINQTKANIAYHKLSFDNINEAFFAFTLNFETQSCEENENAYDVTVKVSVPWVQGFTVYYTQTELAKNNKMFVSLPLDRPYDIYESISDVMVEVHLDPKCSFRISYQFSIFYTMRRLVQHYYPHLLGHLTAAVIFVLGNQFWSDKNIPGISPSKFLQYKSLYLAIGCIILKHIFLDMNFTFTNYNLLSSIYIGAFLQGTAIVLNILIAFGIFIMLKIEKIGLKLLFSSYMQSLGLMAHSGSPILFTSVTVVLIAIALSSCLGIAFILQYIFYSFIISIPYKRISTSDVTESDSLKKKDLKTKKTLGPNNLESPNSKSKGFQNVLYHNVLMFLLLILVVLNVGEIIAWFKSGNSEIINNPFRSPVSICNYFSLCALIILWQFGAPNKFYKNILTSFLLYSCSIICLLFCQENVYCLNYAIALVFGILVLSELCTKLNFIQRL